MRIAKGKSARDSECHHLKDGALYERSAISACFCQVGRRIETDAYNWRVDRPVKRKTKQGRRIINDGY